MHIDATRTYDKITGHVGSFAKVYDGYVKTVFF